MSAPPASAPSLGPIPVDTSKIAQNPFSDDRYLRRELERFAEFFEPIPKDADEVHAGWNHFQKRHGDSSMVQMSLAIDTLKMLQAIHDRLRSTGDDGVGGLIILFHIALLELAERGAQQKSLGSKKAVVRALKQGISDADKRALLRGFRFSKPYPLGTPLPERRHLHCWERKAAGKQVEKYCLSHCPAPLDADLGRLMTSLAEHLYAMRCSFVHRAAWIWFAHVPLQVEGIPDVPVRSSGTMVDGYFNEDNEMITYEVTVEVDELIQVLRRCTWDRLTS